DKGLFERLLFKLVRLLVSDYFPTDGYDRTSDYHREYDNYKYDDSTIDLDDDEYYESASVELANLDLENMETAAISKTGFFKIMMAIATRVLTGYLAHQIVTAWVKKDQRSF